jgi:sporadic carbohydrate cluster protein (TIGR04323 family)
MIQDLRDYEGVAMCSMSMLPERAARRRAIIDKVLAQGCSLHLVLEGVVVASPADIMSLEELIQFSQIAAAAPRQVALEA